MDISNLATSLFNSFLSNHVLLYVGSNVSDEDIRIAAKCKWSAVITSRKEPGFAALFADEKRMPKEFRKRSEIPNKPLSRDSLPIIRLFGVEGDSDDDESDLWATDDSLNLDNAYELITLLPALMDYVNPMSVIGANSDIDLEIFASNRIGKYIHKNISNGAITFWGIPDAKENESEKLKIFRQIAERKAFAIHECSLSEVITLRIAEDEEFIQNQPAPDVENDIFYRGKKPISISQTDLLSFKNIGTLLTDRIVHKIRPFGRIQCRQWFTNFLDLSSTQGPQWYGYLPQSTFYVKRSFEDSLVQLVRRLLSGRGIDGESSEICPIILEGRPGSSKSITLGALAYRIYNEKECPVVYITNEMFLSQGLGTDFELLCDSLEALRDYGGVDSRVLIIWDSSAYRFIVENARRLLKRLQDRGRRVVLVCSSYPVNFYGNDARYFRLKDSNLGIFEQCTEEYDVVQKTGCYFVQATRHMTDREQTLFWQRVKDFSGISTSTISNLRKKLKDEHRNEIFDFYYLLISVLRENLERGLQAEQSKVFSYVQKELHAILEKVCETEENDKRMNSMYQAFLKAGMPIDFIESLALEPDEDETLEDSEDTDEITRRLTRFNTCIALFSRFKIDVPYGLGCAILLKKDTHNPYSTSSRELFDVVTHDIPWLSYGETSDGEYVFRYKNPLEADIFLTNHDINGDEQIDLVCDILSIYGEEYRSSRCVDRLLGEKLQTLLRLLGPNSSYIFRRDFEHKNILRQLNRLTDAIIALKDVYGVPDYDCGFTSIAITFLREYYGYIWDETFKTRADEPDEYRYGTEHFTPADYKVRIDMLDKAITMAESGIEDIQNYCLSQKTLDWASRAHFQQQLDSLAVESALISTEREEIVRNYMSCCKLMKEPVECVTVQFLSYPVIYRQLTSVIQNQPRNGYAYNALFRAYRKAYKRADTQEKKLLYLSEIMQVVELCEFHDSEIMNRGGKSDELSRHLTQIRSDAADFPIDIYTVLHRTDLESDFDDGTKAFFVLYDEMLEHNNPSAITFICQKELRLPKDKKCVDTKTLLDCKKVLDFLTLPCNYSCVSENAYSMALLIRYAWMYFNGNILDGVAECQTTKMTHDQWCEMYKYCSRYESIASTAERQPVILLVYALSTLQVNGLSRKGYFEAQKILNDIPEEIFFQPRMRSPYMICDQDGNPVKYSGTVCDTDVQKSNGQIEVNGIPAQLRTTKGVRFNRHNFGRRTPMPTVNSVLRDLEIAIGYTGFVAYNEAGRKERGGSK